MTSRGCFFHAVLGFTVMTALTARAGEVRPMDSVLRSRADANNRIAVELCELGECAPIGRAAGYSRAQWNEIREICRSEGQYGAYKATAAQVLGLLGFQYVAGLYGGLAAAYIQMLFSDMVDGEAKLLVGDTLSGVLAEDQNFVLSIRDFLKLADALKDCTETWEWYQHPLYKRYNNGWARPLP